MKFFLSQTKYISPTTFEVEFPQLRKVLRYQRAVTRRMVSCGAGTANPYGAPVFTRDF
jgi:hypothetical protein